MENRSKHRRTYLQYEAEDFPLYLFSLLLTGSLLAPILPSALLKGLLFGSLLYLAILFVRKHGVRWDADTVKTLIDGVARYPVDLARSWWLVRERALQVVAIFALAIGVEYAFLPAFSGTRWAAPFPWEWVVWSPFVAITVFRAVVLIAHLLRASHVRTVLEASSLKSTLKGVSIQHHLVQTFLTGLLSHLCLLAPVVLFYALTDPTYLREAVLIVGAVVWSIVSLLSSRFTKSRGSRAAYYRLFHVTHKLAHQSRFYFTVFHGHHHDAVPYAAIGAAGGTGFLESTDRSLGWLDFLGSTVLTQISWLLKVLGDMFAHQYIPGVFPFSKIVVGGRVHHVAHHLGSLRPLGMIMTSYAEPADFAEGYKSNNERVRWFLDQVERYEGLTANAREKFLSVEAHEGTPRKNKNESAIVGEARG